jgi:ligand-binding SRPBCC domain-containing protein
MPVIHLETFINADIDICFDLSRSIDLHKISTTKSKEEAIDGVTSGLINLDETVTWRAIHFGVRQRLTTKITAFNRPYSFRDEQQKGAFKFFIHDHIFEAKNGGTLMKDVFHFQSPFGTAGKIFERVALTGYMRRLLEERNVVIKEFAENGQGSRFCNMNG